MNDGLCPDERHGAAIVAVRSRVLDSPGPKGHAQCTSEYEPIRRTKERTAESITTDHPIVSDTA